jgi:hypothetical protein
MGMSRKAKAHSDEPALLSGPKAQSVERRRYLFSEQEHAFVLRHRRAIEKLENALQGGLQLIADQQGLMDGKFVLTADLTALEEEEHGLA